MRVRHNRRVQSRHFEPGQKGLLVNSRLKFFPGKLKSRWSGSFEAVKVTPYGAIEFCALSGERTFYSEWEKGQTLLGMCN